MSQGTLFFLLIVCIIIIIGMINVRRLGTTIIFLLIIFTPLGISTFNPREVFGITGLNAWNFLWLMAFLFICFRQVVVRSSFGLLRYFSPPVLIWLFFFAIAYLQTAININNIPSYGNFHLSLFSLTFGTYFKSLQYLFTGWIVYQYCNIEGNRIIAERAILVAAIVYALVIAGYFSSGYMSGGYIIGRNIVSESMGMHANAVGALGVYFLFSSVFMKEHGWSKLKTLAVISSLLIIILSFSRISYLTTVILYIYSFKRLKMNERIKSVILIGIMFFLFSSMIIARVHFGMGTSTGKADINEISAGRIDSIWKPLLPEIIKDPVIGKGLFGILQSEATRKGKLLLNDPHSGYLQAFLDMGLAGFLSIVFMMIYFYRLSRKTSDHFFIFVPAILLLCLTGHSFYPKASNYIFWVSYGMALFTINASPPICSDKAFSPDFLK